MWVFPVLAPSVDIEMLSVLMDLEHWNVKCPQEIGMLTVLMKLEYWNAECPQGMGMLSVPKEWEYWNAECPQGKAMPSVPKEWQCQTSPRNGSAMYPSAQSSPIPAPCLPRVI